MMAGNPNWWSNMHPPQAALFPSQYVSVGSANPSLSLDSLHDHHLHAQEPLQSSWSQLLLSGNSSTVTTPELSDQGNDDKLLGINLNQYQPKKLENWEDQMILSTVNPPPRLLIVDHDDHDHVKQEAIIKGRLYGQEDHDNNDIHDHHQVEFQANNNRSANWSQLVMPISSTRSCITSSAIGSTNNNMLDFSYNNNNKAADSARNQSTDHSSECNSTATGVVCKKPRVQPSSSQPPLKVRKEKLGDRITALHQLVSPFGKTDTASVLLEAIGYIRFLQSQIEALSSPYLGHASKNMRNNNQQYVDVEGAKEKQKDLRSRGLCLVPVSCTHHVGSDNGADYWAPSNFGSGF